MIAYNLSDNLSGNASDNLSDKPSVLIKLNKTKQNKEKEGHARAKNSLSKFLQHKINCDILKSPSSIRNR